MDQVVLFHLDITGHNLYEKVQSIATHFILVHVP